MSQSNVKLFEKEEFGKVRVVMQDEDPWFVASDVAKSLGYDNPANAINTHCKKINKITLSPDLGGREISSKMPPVVMNIIPESDVYRLVGRSSLCRSFLPRSKLLPSFFVLLALPAIRPRFLSIKSTGVKRDILFWRLWKWHSKRPPSGRFSTRRS